VRELASTNWDKRPRRVRVRERTVKNMGLPRNSPIWPCGKAGGYVSGSPPTWTSRPRSRSSRTTMRVRRSFLWESVGLSAPLRDTWALVYKTRRASRGCGQARGPEARGAPLRRSRGPRRGGVRRACVPAHTRLVRAGPCGHQGAARRRNARSRLDRRAGADPERGGHRGAPKDRLARRPAQVFSSVSRASAAARRSERLESTWKTFWRSPRARARSSRAARAEARL
jgi:hypothetical protein